MKMTNDKLLIPPSASTAKTKMEWNLTNKVFAVTAGCSPIGKATVRKLAKKGASVVVADQDEMAGNRLAMEITDAGGQAAFVRIDVSNEQDGHTLVQFALDTFGRFDGAVNNIGEPQSVIDMHELNTMELDRMHTTDLRGLFFCMRAELEHFLETRS